MDGDIARLYYDVGPGDAAPVDGDYIRSSGGSLYHVLAVRLSPSIPGRYYLTVARLGRTDSPEGARTLPLYWYKR